MASWVSALIIATLLCVASSGPVAYNPNTHTYLAKRPTSLYCPSFCVPSRTQASIACNPSALCGLKLCLLRTYHGPYSHQGRSSSYGFSCEPKRERKRGPPREPQRKPKEPPRKPKEPKRKPKEPKRKPKEPKRKPKEPKRKPKEPKRKPKEPKRKPKEPKRKPKKTRSPRQLGQGCSRETKCATGLICSCNGICVRLITLDITVAQDDELELFTCNGHRILKAKFGDEVKTTYTGGCTDLFASVTNINGPVALSMMVEVQGGDRYTTGGIAPNLPLSVSIQQSPAAGWEDGDPSFDYSGFRPAVSVTRALASPGILALQADGILPMALSATEDEEAGTFGYRILGDWC